MREYKKPYIEEENIEIEDICGTSTPTKNNDPFNFDDNPDDTL